MRAVDVLPVPRAAEEVGVADAAVAHGVSQGQAHVVLPEHLLEALRAETTVKRLVGSADPCRRRRPRTQPTGGPGASDGSVRASAEQRAAPVIGATARLLRHTAGPAESCCLPALTRFTGDRRAGPGRRTEHGQRTSDDSLPAPLRTGSSGGVRERPNRHDWKSCVGKLNVGRNPTSSARRGRRRGGAAPA